MPPTLPDDRNGLLLQVSVSTLWVNGSLEVVRERLASCRHCQSRSAVSVYEHVAVSDRRAVQVAGVAALRQDCAQCGVRSVECGVWSVGGVELKWGAWSEGGTGWDSAIRASVRWIHK